MKERRMNIGFALLLSVILVISMIAPIASASDWPEFQKDEVNIGRTSDSAPINYYNLSEVVLWSQHTAHGGGYGIDSVPIVVGDYVYVHAPGKLFKYYKNNGNAAGGNWPVAVGGANFQSACPAHGEGKIFVADTGYQGTPRLYAITATSGNEEWSTTVGSYQLSCPITYYNDSSDGEKGRVFFGSVHVVGSSSDAGTYYCYFDDGNLNWSRSSGSGGGYYWAGAAVIGDYLVYGSDKDNLTSVYWRNGTFVDSLNISTSGGTVRDIRSSIAWNATNSNYGHIFFTNKTSGGSAYVSKIGFNKSTGLRGHFNSSDWTSSSDIKYSTSTPVTYKGRVYVGGGNFSTGNPALLCLNESDLTDKKWEFTPNGAVQSSPALSIQGSDVYIYFTTNANNGTVYCLKDGGSSWEEKWKYTTEQARGSGGYILQGVAISDGRVFFGNDGGYLYGINKTDRIHVYDFNDGRGTDKWAFRYQIDNANPPNTCDVPSTEFTSAKYGKIKRVDGVSQQETTDIENYYAAHRFNFSIDETTSDITAINVSWIGKGYHDSAADGVYLYIYNFTSGTYGSAVASTDSGAEVTLTWGNESSASNYISSSGNVTILAEQKSARLLDEDEIWRNSHIWTEYVKLLVHTKA